MKAFACESLLKELIGLPTPGTNEDAGQKLVRRRLAAVCDRVETDIYGDVLGVVNGKAPTRVLLAAHVDEIGLMVSQVDAQGFVQVNLLGGSRPDALVGQRMHIHTAKGPVLGVIGRKPGEAPKEEIKTADLYLDIGAASRAEAEKLVRPGDTVTCTCGFDRLGGDRVAGRGLDDRAGVAAVVRAMEIIRRERRRLKVAVFALSNVQEEGGRFRGAAVSAFQVMPQAALAVDVCYARDYPKMETRLSGDCKLSGGPTLSLSLTVNRAVNRMLEAAAKAKKIPLQYAVEPTSTGTDGDAIASVGPGVATGVVSIPCRYVHSPSEVISLADLDQTAELIAEFVLRMPAKPDFKPI
ncbi:MAG TPA: M20/M25/M40 family metallo-hydrolase [Planctomycetota bacterium]|nr:M20/M25/M40 family metallo-hydrolase [Planctomycetota bacterium]